MVNQNEVRMKRISIACSPEGMDVVYGVDANGVVYRYVEGLQMSWWEKLRMRTDKGDE